MVLVLPLKMDHSLLGGFPVVVRGLIVVHKAQIHQALLNLLHNLMADAKAKVFRSRIRIGQIHVVKARKDLPFQAQGSDGLRHSLDDYGVGGGCGGRCVLVG